MPASITDLIHALWEALENSECLALWEDGAWSLVGCGAEEDFDINPPILILDPTRYLEESPTLKAALADADLRETLRTVITGAGGRVR
jgi:hypothetical protein